MVPKSIKKIIFVKKIPVNKVKFCLAMEPKLTFKNALLDPKKFKNNHYLSEKRESYENNVVS